MAENIRAFPGMFSYYSVRLEAPVVPGVQILVELYYCEPRPNIVLL